MASAAGALARMRHPGFVQIIHDRKFRWTRATKSVPDPTDPCELLVNRPSPIGANVRRDRSAPQANAVKPECAWPRWLAGKDPVDYLVATGTLDEQSTALLLMLALADRDRVIKGWRGDVRNANLESLRRVTEKIVEIVVDVEVLDYERAYQARYAH